MERKKQIRKIYRSFLSVVVCLMFTGCTNKFDAMPDLTEEQHDQIVHYVTGIMLKHDKNYGKLEEDYVIQRYDETERQKKENLEALLASKALENAEEENSDDNDEGSKSDSSDNIPVEAPSVKSISEACGLYDFSIEYNGYTICSSYPEDNSNNAFFALDATEGNMLVVARFTATNISSSDAVLDMFSSNAKFKIGIDGIDEKSALTTLLVDDLSMYRGTISSGSSEELVLLREVPTEMAGSISSLKISIVTPDGKYLIQ